MICDECETVAHCMKNGCVPKTTKKDEAMKLALEALELSAVTVDSFGVQQKTQEAITALREAQAEQPAPKNCRHCGGADNVICAGQCRLQPAQQIAESPDDWSDWKVIPPQPKPAQQEPVAYMVKAHGMLQRLSHRADVADELACQYREDDPNAEVLSLYTSPPAQRTWVGLTDEERQACTQSPFTAENYRAIEAKLKEKNNG